MARTLIRPFFKYQDHYQMIRFTAELLRNDGVWDVHDFLLSTHPGTAEQYLALLAAGARDADLPWSRGYILHTFHFHHPWSHRGFLTCRSAADVVAALFTGAQKCWMSGRRDRAIYQLGRMLHLIQDIFIPHHAAVTIRSGHGQLEEWLGHRWHMHLVRQGGCYSFVQTFRNGDGRAHEVSSQNPYDWIDGPSHIALSWYEEYFGDGWTSAYFPSDLVSNITSHTLRYSAGFINRFFVGLALD
ncbi:MAG: zinc dependent phospholipase C family protein [Bacillota bacterium]